MDWAIFSRCPKGAGRRGASGGLMDLGVVLDMGEPSPTTISLEGIFPADGAAVVSVTAGAPRKGIILFFFFAFPPIGLNAANFHDGQLYQESLVLGCTIVNVTIVD